MFLADSALTKLTPEEINKLPVYRHRIALGLLSIDMLDYLDYQLCRRFGKARLEVSEKMLERLNASFRERMQQLGSMRGMSIPHRSNGLDISSQFDIITKPMPRWNHDGTFFTESEHGQYEDANLCCGEHHSQILTIRYDRTHL